jgi:hypothetical protein
MHTPGVVLVTGFQSQLPENQHSHFCIVLHLGDNTHFLNFKPQNHMGMLTKNKHNLNIPFSFFCRATQSDCKKTSNKY